MITKEIIYKKAFEDKKNSLKERKMQYDMLMSSLYTTEPRLKEIEAGLSKVGAQLAITALSGDKKKIAALKSEASALGKEKKEIIKKAGIKEFKYECELCKDTGYVSGKICDCIKDKAGKIMLAEFSKQMPIKNCRFDNFDLKYYPSKGSNEGENPKRRMTGIFKACKEYVLNFSPETSKSLIFYGDAGLGKTHLTMAIVSGVIEKGYLPVYGSAENLFSIIEKEKFSGENKGSYEIMLDCDLLVIDDLGAEMATAFTKSVLYNLINTRILSGKPTIINTNLTMKKINEKYDARIASRIIGSYDPYLFLGVDVRQQKAIEKQEEF